jgi:hypothetical protein
VAGTPTGWTPPDRVHAREPVVVAERTRWVGWVVFAAVMLALLGLVGLFVGFVAFFDEDYFAQTGAAPRVLAVDQQTWGVLQMVLGAAALLTAAGLLLGNVVARVVAVGVTAVGAVSNLLAIGAYPFWSVVMIAIDVLIIYAITVHGRELGRAG